MTTLTVGLRSIGAVGPGASDWPTLCAILAGTAPYRHAPTALSVPAALPAAERRRLGRAVQVALMAGSEALDVTDIDAQSLPTVFASSGGDGENCDAICRALTGNDPQLSPTRFHNSVQNAPAGYWGIARNATAASTSIGGFDGSFGVGLLEAATQVLTDSCAVLLIAYDTNYPEPLRSTRPIPDAFGVAMLLQPAHRAGALAQLALELTAQPVDRIDDPQLEQLRATIPAARALPLLCQLARGASGGVVLDYLPPTALSVQVLSGV